MNCNCEKSTRMGGWSYSVIAVFAAAVAFGTAWAAESPNGLTVAPINYSATGCNLDHSAVLSWSGGVGETGYKVYRFIGAPGALKPAPVATLAGSTTTWTDTSATVGVEYTYAVTAVDADGESPLSNTVTWRKLQNLTKYGSFTNAGGGLDPSKTDEELNRILTNGTAGSGDVVRGTGSPRFRFSFSSPVILREARVWRPSTYWETAISKHQILVTVNGSTVYPFGASAFAEAGINDWQYHTVQASYQNTEFSTLDYLGDSVWYTCVVSEIEYYGYVPSEAEAAIAANTPTASGTAANGAVSLTWSDTGTTYLVYRREHDNANDDWTCVNDNVSGTTYTDTTASFTAGGINYDYCIGAVDTNGDTKFSPVTVVLCKTGAICWWDNLNVKAIAYPGAAGWNNPNATKPHFLSRDRTGTALLAAMSTDDGTLPAMAFDLQKLANGNGELLSREAGARSWWIYGANAYTPWLNKGYCWKGAAATDDLIFWANGTGASRTIAVVARATGKEDIYEYRDSNGGTAYYYNMNGGLDASADGNYLYANCGADNSKNEIYKFAIDRAAKTLQVVGSFTASGITQIRNLAVYTVGGAEVAVFGEGSGGGKLAVMNLADGATAVMSAPELSGNIMNVKLADTTDGLYLVAQNDGGDVAVYAFDAAAKTITHVKSIAAATMAPLYGGSGTQHRNLEMTADGHYAFIMRNAGADTRLTVVGATVTTVPERAPGSLTATANATQNAVNLAWTDVADVTATGVRVLRAQTGKAGSAVLADLPLGTTEYTDDTAVGGIDYTYAVAYINVYEGKTIAGPTVTADCAPFMQNLSNYGTWSVASGAYYSGNPLKNLTDGNTNNMLLDDGANATYRIQFTNPAEIRLVRVMRPAQGYWGDNYTDSWFVNGLIGNNSTRLATVSGVYGLNTWEEKTVPEAYAQTAFTAMDYHHGGTWYSATRELEIYGYVPAEVAAAKAKSSEAVAMVAPVLTADANGTLTWTEDASVPEVAVRIYRARMAEGPFKLAGEVAPGVCVFNDPDTAMGVTYYYLISYVTEDRGVNIEGVKSAPVASKKPVAVESVLLTENGAATKQYGQWVANAWDSINHSPANAFDGNVNNNVDFGVDASENWAAFVGYNFNEPVKIIATRFRKLVWSSGRNSGLQFYVSGAPATFVSGSRWTMPASKTAIGGTSPSDSETSTGSWWEQDGLDSPWCRCAFVWKNSYWGGNCQEIEFYGYTKSMEAAAEATAGANVVLPVENVSVTMDGAALTLSWELKGKAAMALTVKHRVAGDAWATVATLPGDATAWTTTAWTTTDAVAVGEHNEYRIEVTDGEDTVWAEKDFAVRPLLAQGARTVVGGDATSAWDYLAIGNTSGISVTCTVGAAVSGGATAALEVRPSLGAEPVAALALTDAGTYRIVIVGGKATLMKQTDGVWSVLSETETAASGEMLVGVRVTAGAIASVGKIDISDIKMTYPGTILTVR